MTRRRALLPDYAKDFERPGWSTNSKSLFKYTPEQIAQEKMLKLDEKKEKGRKQADRKKGKATG